MVQGNGRRKKKGGLRKAKAQVAKEPKLKFNTVGVRFLTGNDVIKIYTYKVPKDKKVLLGQELIADTPRGPAICAVVRLDKTPHIPEVYEEQYGALDAARHMKWIERKAVPL